MAISGMEIPCVNNIRVRAFEQGPAKHKKGVLMRVEENRFSRYLSQRTQNEIMTVAD